MRRLALLLFLPALAAAQPDAVYEPPADTVAYGTGGGMAILLTEYGFGLGGLYRVPVGPSTSSLVELGVAVAKDEREQQFFVGFFGDTVVPFKRNYALIVPLQAGVEQRLFAETIESNFRPYAQLTAGPALAYQWPYFEDLDGDGVRQAGEELYGPFRGLGKGSFRGGVGATLGVGAYFGQRRRSAQGVRFAYALQYFFAPVDLLEPHPRVADPSRRFFGTPVVSFHFVRLLGG